MGVDVESDWANAGEANVATEAIATRNQIQAIPRFIRFSQVTVRGKRIPTPA
jgi:hypothetical protein